MSADTHAPPSDLPTPRTFDARRLLALVRKESLQVVRDPSALVIAFVLPALLLFLFAYAVSLDVEGVRLGVVVEGDGDAAHELAAAFGATHYFDVVRAHDRREIEDQIVAGTLRGMVVIPRRFDRDLLAAGDLPGSAEVLVIADGSQPNTAKFLAGYAEGVLANWWASRGAAMPPPPPIALEERVWFNPEIESRRFLVPGAIAIVMTMIGTLLTALVVAREWERGTLEALFSTPASILEILVGKLLPYFVLGLLATLGCTLLATTVFDVPLRGSLFALLTLSSAFLVPALGQGLLISAVARNQFVASQLALLSAFLPAFLLSGFLFPIESMPGWIQAITTVIAARYFVTSLQTVFLAGDVWTIFWPNLSAMLVIGLVFVVLTAAKTRKSLDR